MHHLIATQVTDVHSQELHIKLLSFLPYGCGNHISKFMHKTFSGY